MHLTPKAFDLLSLLIAEAPRVVTKAELHRHLWPDSFVSDASLLGLVKEVRRALNDDGGGALIRTAHRIGYAFAAPLDSGPNAATPSAAWVMVGDVCVPLTEGENLIGRGAACVVRVDLPGISRRVTPPRALRRRRASRRQGSRVKARRLATTVTPSCSRPSVK